MSITGNIKTMPLAELLQWLSQGEKTGTLVIHNAQVEKKIFFERGMVISSASTDPREHLGHFLVSHGFITEDQLAAGMRKQTETRVLLGKILTDMGAIGPIELDAMLRLKCEETIYEIFRWTEGEFRFLEEAQQLPMVRITIDVQALILEAMQRVDDWERIRAIIHSPRAIPVQVAEWDQSELSPGAERILATVNDSNSVEDICLESHASEFYACKVLFDQYQAGRLRVANPRGAGEVDRASLPVTVDADALVRLAQTYLQGGDFERAARHFRAARSLDPDSKKVQTTAQKAEDRIRQELESQGVLLSAVPTLSRRMEELTTVPISPQEGFMLSRINGQYDIASILKISPMPPLEAQIVFWKLLKAGHIALKPAAKK